MIYLHTMTVHSFFYTAVLAVILFSAPLYAFAQEAVPSAVPQPQTESVATPTETPAESTSVPQPIPPIPLQSNAGDDRNVLVGRTVLFDASGSTGPADQPLTYAWDFGDNTRAAGIDATHVYKNSGTYRVTLTVTSGAGTNAPTSEDTIIVAVQDRIMILVSDQSIPQKDVRAFQDYALTQGVLLVSIRDTKETQEYLLTQSLAQQMVNNEVDIAAADILITWTDDHSGLNALTEFARVLDVSEIPFERFRFSSKAIVSISSQALRTSEKVAQTAFQSIHPRYLIVSDSNMIDDAIQAASAEELERSLTNTDAQFRLVTDYTLRGIEQLSPFNFMSTLLNDMVNRGVPLNSIYLILMLPVMATVIAAARQVVGIKAFGIFAPTVIALSFLSTGLKYGLTIFFTIIVFGSIARLIARQFRLLYLPRMAIVLSMLALAMLGMFFVGAFFDKTGFIGISIFPILIMTVVTEHFVSVQIEQGLRAAIKLTLETVILSMIGYFIGNWTLFKTTILAYPELIFLTFLFNFLLGKFSGLRLTEYIRFRNIFKHLRNAEKSQ